MKPQVGSRPAAGEYVFAGDAAAGRPRRWRRWLVPAAWVAVAAALFVCYLHVSQTEPSDSYGPDFTLQAWDMLHGNLLLHGWWLSDVSFYTTELPEYMLVVLVHGANAGVVHVAAAITYTLLVLTAALLAKGRAGGRQGTAAAVIAAGIMLAPQHGNGVFVLLLAPDHVGTCIPVLLTWLILDRARPRWYVPVAVAALLAWVLVADPLVLVIGVLPLVAVCTLRVCRGAVRQGLPLRSQWYELSLIAAGLAAAAAAELALALIRAHNGFVVAPVAPGLTRIGQLPHHVLLLAEGLLLLFGAGLSGQHLGPGLAVPLVHLTGLALAAWGTCAGARRFSRDGDLVVQLLVTAIALNLAGFVLWSSVTGIISTREMAAVLPFGAVLAGRLLAGRLAAARLLPALSLVLLTYLGSMVQLAMLPPQPPQFQPLASWLTRHDLRYGLGANWLGGAVTLGSGERVRLLPVSRRGRVLVPSKWEAQASWFDPRLHDANFVALIGRPPRPPLWSAWATFGPPAQTHRFAAYTVLVWKKNLLTDLAGRGSGRHRGGAAGRRRRAGLGERWSAPPAQGVALAGGARLRRSRHGGVGRCRKEPPQISQAKLTVSCRDALYSLDIWSVYAVRAGAPDARPRAGPGGPAGRVPTCRPSGCADAPADRAERANWDISHFNFPAVRSSPGPQRPHRSAVKGVRMNRHRSTSRTSASCAVLAVAVLALAGCGSGSSSPAVPPSSSPPSASAGSAAASAPSGSSSFSGTPLFPVAVGNTWVYQTTVAGITTGTTVDKVVSVAPVPGGNQVVTTHAYRGATVKETLLFDTDGSITTPLPSLGSGGTVTVKSGGIVWPSQAQIDSGQAHTSAIVLTTTIGGQTRTITTHVTVRGAGSATVTVPAGTYQTTIIDSTLAEKIAGISLSILIRTWLANGVGPVKDQVTTDGTVVSGEELKSFTKG